MSGVTLQAQRRHGYLCDTPVWNAVTSGRPSSVAGQWTCAHRSGDLRSTLTCRLLHLPSPPDAATEGRSTARPQAMRMPGKYL
ncbi:hypothetical protein MKX07_006537 [Trichoderma sp. CBMAI-0711]|nr:hypothetical protein MKX07_006537 [Trichoderma sp. CBMAI-0711]